MAEALTHKRLMQAITDRAAALRCTRKLQPAGGPGTKVFPPTFAGAVYSTEERRIDGKSVPCVVLDTVQSQANRMEEALQEAVDGGRISLPVVKVDFDAGDTEAKLLHPIGRITSLEAPHRLADAILRDSLHEGVPFRESEAATGLNGASLKNATPLYELGPTALVFGMWDSTGPRGGLGAKFERAIVSEVVGINCPEAFLGRRDAAGKLAAPPPKAFGLRRDPVNASKNAGPVYMTPTGQMTLDPLEAEEESTGAGKGTGKRRLYGLDKKTKKPVYIKPDPSSSVEAGRPSAANHGNVPFDADNVGLTIDHAEQTTTLSLIALRRLRFPAADGTRKPEQEAAAHAVLAAVGLCAAALAADAGLDLRSRCLLWPEEEMTWELLATPGETLERFSLPAAAAVTLLKDAVVAAEKTGLSWRSEPLRLTPSSQLIELVARSQAFEAKNPTEGD